jgi:CRISPR-associated endonuclease/helicase Cas3
LLEEYPLKPHELLRDNSQRVFDRLKKLKAGKGTRVWLVDDDDEVEVTTLGDIIGAGKEAIERKTVLLPPSAGGLSGGFLDPDSTEANDVSGGEFYRNERGEPRRTRLWDDDEPPDGMRRVLTIDTKPTDEADEEPTGKRFWHWYELRYGGDDEGIENSKKPVSWATHTNDVVEHTKSIVGKVLPDLADLFRIAAECHDLGKRRKLFQTVLGNRKYPEVELAKSGKKGGRVEERYRHEFGSLFNAEAHEDFKNLQDEEKAFVLHLIAAHHGRGRPHFPADEAFDPEPKGRDAAEVAREVPRRFARLQRMYGRWGLAYLESLLRAADYAASACPSKFEPEGGE